MADVLLYTTRYCPFCIRAKQMLDTKGVDYREISVDGNPQLRAQMTAKAGQHTVPQIWINNQHVGGCTDLMQLDATDQLDTLLTE